MKLFKFPEENHINEYISDFIKEDFHFTYNTELHIYKYKHIITISSYQHHTW